MRKLRLFMLAIVALFALGQSVTNAADMYMYMRDNGTSTKEGANEMTTIKDGVYAIYSRNIPTYNYTAYNYANGIYFSSTVSTSIDGLAGSTIYQAPSGKFTQGSADSSAGWLGSSQEGCEVITYSYPMNPICVQYGTWDIYLDTNESKMYVLTPGEKPEFLGDLPEPEPVYNNYYVWAGGVEMTEDDLNTNAQLNAWWGCTTADYTDAELPGGKGISWTAASATTFSSGFWYEGNVAPLADKYLNFYYKTKANLKFNIKLTSNETAGTENAAQELAVELNQDGRWHIASIPVASVYTDVAEAWALAATTGGNIFSLIGVDAPEGAVIYTGPIWYGAKTDDINTEPIEPEVNYLWYAGALNGWEFTQVEVVDGVATFTGDFTTDKKFKISLAETVTDWNEFNAGALYVEGIIEKGTPYDLVEGDQDNILANLGNWTIAVDVNAKTLTATLNGEPLPEPKPEPVGDVIWYAGSLNDWTFASVEIVEGKATISGIFPEDQDPKIKLSTTEPGGDYNGWEGFNEGALTTSETVALNTPVVLFPGDADIVLPQVGALVLVLDVNTLELTVTEEAGIEAIEAETGASVWYTLQGIRVERPTTGNAYIRVNGTKADKVIF